MLVSFHRDTDTSHRVSVHRVDGSTETLELDTRSFPRHDLAHWVVEAELGLTGGVWGSVEAGGSLSGEGLDGDDMAVAESLAGPMQTLLRIAATADEIHSTLAGIQPGLIDADVAERLHARARSIVGRWNATRFGASMELNWPE